MKDHVETRYVLFCIDDDGILVAKYKPGIRKINLEIAKEIVAARLLFQNGLSYLSLITIDHSFELTKEAIAYFSGAEGIRGLNAIAIVVPRSNLFSLAIADFIIRVRRPRIRIRVYSEEEKARTWLSKQKPKVRTYEK